MSATQTLPTNTVNENKKKKSRKPSPSEAARQDRHSRRDASFLVALKQEAARKETRAAQRELDRIRQNQRGWKLVLPSCVRHLHKTALAPTTSPSGHGLFKPRKTSANFNNYTPKSGCGPPKPSKTKRHSTFRVQPPPPLPLSLIHI